MYVAVAVAIIHRKHGLKVTEGESRSSTVAQGGIHQKVLKVRLTGLKIVREDAFT